MTNALWLAWLRLILFERLLRIAERSLIWHAIARLPRPVFWGLVLVLVCVAIAGVLRRRRR